MYADVVPGIEEQQPRAISFDLFFADADIRDREGDLAFNRALKNRKNVYFPIQRLDQETDAKGVPLKLVSAALGLGRTASAQGAARIQLLQPRVIDQAHWRRSGIVNFLEDSDGMGAVTGSTCRRTDGCCPRFPRVSAAHGLPVPDQPRTTTSRLPRSRPGR